MWTIWKNYPCLSVDALMLAGHCEVVVYDVSSACESLWTIVPISSCRRGCCGLVGTCYKVLLWVSSCRSHFWCVLDSHMHNGRMSIPWRSRKAKWYWRSFYAKLFGLPWSGDCSPLTRSRGLIPTLTSLRIPFPLADNILLSVMTCRKRRHLLRMAWMEGGALFFLNYSMGNMSYSLGGTGTHCCG